MKFILETKYSDEIEVPQYIIDTIRQIGKENKITAIKLFRFYVEEKFPGIINLIGAKNSVDSILFPGGYPGSIHNGTKINLSEGE